MSDTPDPRLRLSFMFPDESPGPLTFDVECNDATVDLTQFVRDVLDSVARQYRDAVRVGTRATDGLSGVAEAVPLTRGARPAPFLVSQSGNAAAGIHREVATP